MSVWLFVLLGIDLAFMGYHLISVWATDAGMTSRWLVSYRWRVTTDFGFPEIFQYGQTLLAMVLLVRLFLVERWRTALAWTAVLLYVVADDSMSLHETGGGWLVAHLGLPGVAGLSGQDIGELTVWALVALVLLPLLIWAWRGDGGPARRLYLEMLGLFAVFAFAGGGLDAVHSELHRLRGFDLLLSLGEDGGEMVVMSVIVARLLAFHESRGLPVAAVWPWTWRLGSRSGAPDATDRAPAVTQARQGVSQRNA